MRPLRSCIVRGAIVALLVLMTSWSQSLGGDDSVANAYRHDISNGFALIDKYGTSRSINDLRLAVLSLSHVSVDRTQPSSDIPTRRLLTKAWTLWFKSFDLTFDPSFDENDPKNKFFISLPAPEGQQPGVDPRQILNPRTRERYTRVFTENQNVAANSTYQLQMRNLLQSAILSVRVGFGNFKAESPSDDAALSAIIRGASLSKMRANQLENFATGTNEQHTRC